MSPNEISDPGGDMSSFHTRIDLHDATSLDYIDLNNAMIERGFQRTMLGADRRVQHLSQAQYLFHSNGSGLDERERINFLAVQSINAIKKVGSVVTVETGFVSPSIGDVDRYRQRAFV